MKIKEFLKPTWKKILAFLAVPFILAAVIFLNILLNVTIGFIPSVVSVASAILGIFIFIAIIPFFILSIIFFDFFGVQPFPDVSVGGTVESASELLIVLSIILWWYGLACLTVFVYEKTKQDFRIKCKINKNLEQ